MRHDNDTFRSIASAAGLAQVSSRLGSVSALRAWSVITALAVSVVGCGGGSPDDETSGTDGGINPVTLACDAANGNGVNGLSLYNPSNLIAYTLSDLIANAVVNSSLTWGVQYQNPSVPAGSYSGSLRARLWAVSSPYSGGTITGRVLGLFTPNFTGPGARSATQVFAGGHSSSSLQSSAQQQNPATGSYCLVATLEEFSSSCTNSDGFCIDDWIQFPAPVGFR